MGVLQFEPKQSDSRACALVQVWCEKEDQMKLSSGICGHSRHYSPCPLTQRGMYTGQQGWYVGKRLLKVRREYSSSSFCLLLISYSRL